MTNKELQDWLKTKPDEMIIRGSVRISGSRNDTDEITPYVATSYGLEDWIEFRIVLDRYSDFEKGVNCEVETY